MPQEVENKCCGQQRCMSTHTRFAKLCLDPDVLQLNMINEGNVPNDKEDNSTRPFNFPKCVCLFIYLFIFEPDV